MFLQHRLFQGATRSPETARPCQVPPTQQPSRSPAKERASQPNSASDDFSKLPSRRRQVITTPKYISFWLSGRALDSGQEKRHFKSPCLCFFASFFFCCIAVLLFVLLYTHDGFEGCCWMVLSAVYCALLLYNVPGTAVLL